MLSNQELNHRIHRILPELIELRHHLHRHPQLAYEETYANERIRAELDRSGVPYESGIAATGVVGWIEPEPGLPAGDRGWAVGLRADMDALPISEDTGLPYASEHPGLMHACGHDGHTAILVGVARVLAELRRELPRPVKLLFQPAEEGRAGARRMLNEGALDAAVGGMPVGAVFGLHADPSQSVGQLATRPGPYMASADELRITVRGQGGHGAMPHLGSDPILAASHIVTALQSVVSRNANPIASAVVSLGSIQGGRAFNVIPDEVTMVGTIRAFDEELWRLIHRRIERLVPQVAQAMGCAAHVSFSEAYPTLINDPRLTDYAADLAAEALGAEQVNAQSEPLMGAEDFAFYRQRAAGCFAFIGVCPPAMNDYPGLHSNRFDFTDEAIAVGVRLMCRWALQADRIEPSAER